MSSMNRVFLMGNLTRDPNLRKTPSGQAVCDLGLAISEKYRNKSGETAESVCFADLVAWGRQAELCGQYLTKGKPVLVEGRLQFDQWKTEQGENRSKIRVRVDRLTFLGKPKNAPETTDSAEHAPMADPADPF